MILAHAHGEYSFYAHLIPGSLQVRLGDSVRQGQVLAHLGNSGNSDALHLHFQLMDGPDLLSARGLPCSFVNLRDVMGQMVGAELPNHLWVHALPF